jgi:hypothetical protein|tara:strand:+ start:266 stop:445 length:180 start_codon:yes stop_codon:yes gene_type:complete
MNKNKCKVLQTVTTVEGTLYEGEVVTVQDKEKNGDIRVKDTMGKIWYIKDDILKSMEGK